jgi:alpha-methylacyl-CoA racemase
MNPIDKATFDRLDSGAHFYETYKTLDAKYMAVGSLEPQFYEKLMEGLGLTSESDYVEQFGDFEEGKAILAKKFASKTQQEWTEIFDKLDACVTPVLEMEEAPLHRLNQSRNAFFKSHCGQWDPEPAPRLSRTPGKINVSNPDPEIGEQTVEILKEAGFESEAITAFIEDGVVGAAEIKSKL